MSLKKKRAVTVLAGWLEAAAVPFEMAAPTSLLIKGKSESFQIEIDDANAGELTGSLDRAMPAFWLVTERAGYGRPEVVQRGEAPKGVRYKDDPEMVAMRHREFRQVANLPAHVYENTHYKKIITWYCTKFYRANLYLCQASGYEVEDIKTYAWLYLTNFYGRWRHLDRETFGEAGYGNGKMFCSYLQQRLYSDLKPLLVRKARSIVIDAETAELGTGVEFMTQYEDGDERPVHVAVAVVPELDLEALFEDLGHDEAVGKLLAAIEDGLAGASRRLADHRADCVDCCEQVICGVTDVGGTECSLD